ncbi:FAD-binding oxidoreductase [Nitratireductor aquimarinus]|uniref:FAD-binding oxidoreductase n=1 Tax=Nitratireductor TaxID=245876 RepID=UPI0019D3A04C|nr:MULTISPECIES: FAD-binding oxidoreductase [Nitratireductor]MBN7774716.1 FAD-binding oxidoreductase [Nitratireductor pacificus]MBN7779577.1 FAD-binding oxidoreductase [Nitratireductor pacificus]MBN7788384.1 FAD-binding oxidoreductase [Nitratireductor aquimarinus]MBY6097103.1 FAD-binding oxidoreductase [Nitratireductor aquimarinus]MCA1261740.1 FAD-binding oxidoreductase [Nitratireductor aquimarinus]
MADYSAFGLVRRRAPVAIGAEDAVESLRAGRGLPSSVLPYGNGRSYGDTCLNDAGALIDMRPMNRIVAFDEQSGLLTAQAGLMLSDVIAHVGPKGWFPAVVPGTRFVTLGGAIANDVHGKNHHRRGTFGCHVVSFTLLRSDGEVRRCSADENAELFRATIGGMGLTGLILDATIRLMKVASVDVNECVRGFSGLDEYFDLAEDADARNEYAVAWLDQLASGPKAGRGFLLTANHAEDGAVFRATSPRRLTVPFRPPLNLLNRWSLTLFNRAFAWSKARAEGVRRSSYESYFFPLDAVRHWNRLYGPRGLLQHQSVVPFEAARETIPAMLAAAREAGQASFLTVLKRFGDVASPGMLSFPRPGYTLTLDFSNAGAATDALFERLDRMTVEAGGAVNPYKDARMGPALFEASFPHWRDLEALRDPAFLSDFWRRTAQKLPASEAGGRHAAE